MDWPIFTGGAYLTPLNKGSRISISLACKLVREHPCHKLRVDVSSSNFPRFDRNLNTGGNNYDEDEGVIRHNVVHHDSQHPSEITLTVVPNAEAMMDEDSGKSD